jgi:hypothetical protein
MHRQTPLFTCLLNSIQQWENLILLNRRAVCNPGQTLYRRWLFLLVGAKAGTWPNGGVGAANAGAFGVNGAAAGGGVKVEAVIVGPPGQGKDFIFEVEMVDNTACCNFLASFLAVPATQRHR